MADFALEITVADGHALTRVDFTGLAVAAEPAKREAMGESVKDDPAPDAASGWLWQPGLDPRLPVDWPSTDLSI